MKLYKVIIFQNGKKKTQAVGDNLKKLKEWAVSCQKEDSNITFELYEEV